MHIRIVDNARTCAIRNLLLVRLCVPTTASGSKVFLCHVITLTVQMRKQNFLFIMCGQNKRRIAGALSVVGVNSGTID
jgi:hypothetical protein